MEKQTLKPIHKLYNKLTYWDSYGTQVVISILIILTFTFMIGYYYVLNNIEPIKNDWVNQRCNPLIMPFAGIINKPNNKTASEFVGENFTYCTQNIIKDFAGHSTKPIQFSMSVLSKFFLMMLNVLDNVRKMLSRMREQLSAIVEVIFSRMLNIIISLQEFFINLKDVFAKTVGILTSGFYVLLGSYYTLKSSIGAMFQFIVIILFILIGMIIPLWIVPFTFPMAAMLTVVFLSIAIPLSIIAIMMNQTMGTNLSGIPSAPSCFDSNTIINNNISIENINVGDYIDNDNYITAKMKMSSNNENLYNINNVYVTGEHKLYNNDSTIFIKDHKLSKITDNKNFKLFNINTSNKNIELNQLNFCDYDEMTSNEILKLRNVFKNKTNTKAKSLDFIHHYFDGGFHETTLIKLIDGKYKTIKDINCDDMLDGFNRVIGVVEIKGDDLYHSLCYNKTNDIYASANISLIHLGKEKSMKDDSTIYEETIKPNKLYHLITDSGYFLINNIMFNDYNHLIESYL